MDFHGLLSVTLVLFYLAFPALVIRLCARIPFLNKIGAVILCYIMGFILGNSGLIPESLSKMQQGMSEVGVALAMPLLLFSMDVRRWLKIAGKAMLCMTGATISILLVAGFAVFLVHDSLPEAWKLGGMAVGVYTGGTPNLAAIKEALGVDTTTFVIMHTYDTVVSFAYIGFCMLAAQPLLNLWLPKFVSPRTEAEQGQFEKEDIHSYAGMFSAKILLPLAGAMGLVVLIIAAAVGISGLFPESASTPISILIITTGGIAGSFIRRIRSIQKTFQMGMYLIFVFCLVVGSMVNFKDLINIHWPILILVSVSIYGSFFLHALFCRIFSIDTDTFIITSVSAICSPPFVPPVAGALKNKEIILSGITTGIIGYAIGNYLGISFAYIYRALFGG